MPVRYAYSSVGCFMFSCLPDSVIFLSAYFDNGGMITGVYFKLKKADANEIKAAMDDYISRRKDKQPLEYPSAGSTFKRPQG